MTLAILDARDKEYVVVAAGADLIATYVQQAILAGQTAQEVLDAILAAGLSEGVFPSLAAGESGTTDGQYFWVGDGGTVTLYLNDSGTGDEIAELATAAGLSESQIFEQDGVGAEAENIKSRLRRTKQALDFIPNGLRVGVMDGTNATVLTAYIQAAVDATPDGWTLEFQGDGWIMGVVDIEQSIRLAGPATITLSGSGARFRFNASFDTFVADNLTIIGDGNAASDHYGFAPTTSSIVVQNATFNNIIVRNTVNGIDCSAMVNFRVTGGKIGPTVPATSPAPGQGYGVAGGTNSKIGSVWGVHFYRCARHSVYFGHLNSGTVMGCTFEEHAYGATPTLGALAALSMARGQGNTATGNHFLNCVTCPVEISDESSLSGQATNFIVSSNEFRGCPQPCVIGGTGAVGVDNQTNAVIWSQNNHFMPTGASECLRIFQGSGLSVRDNQFLFPGGDVAATAITVDDTVADQPTGLAIGDNSMFSSPSSGTSYLVYLDTGIGSSSSTAAIRIKGNEVFGTTKLFISAASPLRNPNVRTDTVDRLALSSGTTPSVAGYSMLEMSYASATTITDFLDSFDGQSIELYFTNGNATLSNSNFYLAGGVNFIGSAADVLVLKRISGAWREVSRSVN